MGFQGRDSGKDALGPGSPVQPAFVPTRVGSPGARGRDAGGSGRTDLVPGPLQQQQPQLFQAAVDAISAPLLHQRLQHLGPAGEEERADGTKTQRGRARAWGPRRWDSPASTPFPETPESRGPGPLDPSPLPRPAPLGSVSEARLLSLPGLPHPPLSVLSSLLPSLCLSFSFLSTSPHRAVSLCLSGEL